jgi:hypothetical protein
MKKIRIRADPQHCHSDSDITYSREPLIATTQLQLITDTGNEAEFGQVRGLFLPDKADFYGLASPPFRQCFL